MAQMRKSAPPKKPLTPQTARKIVKGEIVRQSTLDQIRKDGMKKAIGKVKSGKATPEYKTGTIRMYGSARVVTPKPAVKKPKGFDGIATRGMLNTMQVSEKAVKNAAKAYIAYTKAVTVDAPKTIKKVDKFIDKNMPAAKRIAKQAIADGISAYGGGTKKKAPQLRKRAK
jgi:hypothetical protein